MKRLNIGFISFLMLLSLVCIGFSSWNIVYDRSDYVNGNIDVDEILPNVIETNYKCFSYYDNHFLNYSTDENNKPVVSLSNTGFITITINIIDIEKVNSYENPTLNLLFEQKTTENNLSSIINNTYLNKVYLNNQDLTSSLKFNSDNFTFQCNLSGTILNEYIFKIEFVVNDSNRSDFFENLMNQKIKFSYLATIEGD